MSMTSKPGVHGTRYSVPDICTAEARGGVDNPREVIGIASCEDLKPCV